MAAVARDIPVQVVGGSKFGLYNKINARKTYNMFESDGWLVCYSGWKKIIEIAGAGSDIEGRGVFTSIRGQINIGVSGSAVYKFSATGGVEIIGNISTFQGPVFMAENLNSQIAIVDGVNLYIYNRSTNALVKQQQFSFGGTLPEDLTPNYVAFHNNYFLVGNGNTTANGSRFYALEFLDANTVQVANGGQLSLQTKPDYAKAAVRLSEKGNNILVFGTSVTEIQVNSPKVENGQILLYQRNQSINIDYGVLSVATIAWSDNFVVWLASNEKSPPVIMYCDGGVPSTLSTDGINAQLQRLKNPEKSIGFIYKQDGHVFYQITFYDSRDNLSLIYDFKAKSFYHVSDERLCFHPAREVIYFQNKTYFISLTNGGFYEISTDYTTYDDNVPNVGETGYDISKNHIIPRQVICDTFRTDGVPRPFIVREFNVTIENGSDDTWTKYTNSEEIKEDIITEDDELIVTENNERVVTETFSQYDNPYFPKVSLSFSPNGGEVYGNEVSKHINFVGRRQNIVNWNRVGRMNECTPKLKFWGAARFVVGNGNMRISQCYG